MRFRAIPLIAFAGPLAALAFAQETAKVDFARDIQPILRDHCVECHGPSQQMRGLRLDRRRDALPNRVGANGARITPGNSAASALYLRVSGTASGARMPPAGPLPGEQIALIKAWIDQGADWPDALSGDRTTALADPTVVKIMTALRNGNRSHLIRALQANPESINAKGHGGWTPLMYAALYGDAAAVGLLLDKGANVNAQNEDGATALMYAIDNVEKTRLLLDHKANPNLRSGQGRTALLIAVQWPGSYPIAKLLIERGADVKAKLPNGPGALPLAARVGDAALLQLLLDHGVETKPVPLGAVPADCAACFDLLLKLAEPSDLSGALGAAIRAGNLSRIDFLLDRNAKPGRGVIEMIALSTAKIPAPTIKRLIAAGADVNAKTQAGLTQIAFAKRQGNATLVNALTESGLRDETPAAPTLQPKPAASPRAAVERSLPSLQRSGVTFLQKAGCVSCHNNSLTQMTTTAARAKGLGVNGALVKEQQQRIAAFLDENRESAHSNIGIPGGVDTVSYILLGLAADNYPSNAITDVWARYMKNNQSPDGRWKCLANRPPLESSDFEVTAASIRALRTYAPPSQKAAYDATIARAVQWLTTAQPKSTEDHAFKILGLTWGKGSRDAIRATANALLALQRSDGGWGQTAVLPTDAYATGQALSALHESKAVATANPAYQRGVLYLMNTQLEDGSWYVQSRAPAFQPYFDSDFPHGPDQFISVAATNWAALALLPAVR